MTAPTRGGGVRLDPPGPAPTALGRFGEFGGRFVPETIVAALDWARANQDVRAIVLRVNSPGGSALASAIITDRSLIPEEAKERLGLLIGKYL